MKRERSCGLCSSKVDTSRSVLCSGTAHEICTDPCARDSSCGAGDLMRHQFHFSLLQWNPGPARRNPTNIVSAACGRFHEVMSRTSLITSEHTPTTRTLPSCSTKTPLSQTLLFSRSRPTLRAKAHGAWCYSLFAPCSVVLPFLEHLQSHFARYISTMLWPRNVTHPLSFSNFFMPKCWSTMSTS